MASASTLERKDTSRDWIKTSLDFFKKVADSTTNVPFVKGSATATIKILGLLDSVKTNQSECERLAKRVIEITHRIAENAERVKTNDELDGLRSDLQAYSKTLEAVQAYVESQTSRKFTRRLLSQTEDASMLQDLDANLDQASRTFVENSLIRLRGSVAELARTQVAHHDEILTRLGLLNIGPAFARVTVPAEHRLPPAPRVFFGRDNLIADITSAVVSDLPARFALLGAGGMGKSTATLAVFHHPDVVAHFKDERYFVRCDAARNCDDMIRALANDLGLTGEKLSDQIWGFLAERRPVLLGLDNLEDCLEDTATVEEYLTRLSSLQHVALILTLRGTQPPYGPSWTEPHPTPLEPLDEESARQTFVTISDKEDENLSALLRELCCIPLAITLAAVLARADETPTTLLERWTQETTSMLDRGQDHRAMSVDFSIRLSIESHLMRRSPDALLLLSLASHLPDGILNGKMLRVVPRGLKARQAASVLFRTVLAQYDAKHDLRMHALVRAYVRAHHPPDTALLAPLEEFYLRQAVLPELPETKEAADAFNAMTPEVDNLISVLEFIFKSLEKRRLGTLQNGEQSSITIFGVNIAKAVTGLASLQLWSGVGSLSALNMAVRESRYADKSCQAWCLRTLGRTELGRTESLNSLQHAKEAKALFQGLGNDAAMSDCLISSADALLLLGRPKEAEEDLKEAMEIKRTLQDTTGVIYCLIHEGRSLFYPGRYLEAGVALSEALTLAQSVKHKILEGLVLAELANVQLDQHLHAAAQASATKALGIAQALGNWRLVAVCTWMTGECLRREDQYAEAKTVLKTGLSLAQRVNHWYIVLSCNGSLSEILVAQGDYRAARKYLQEVMDLSGLMGSMPGLSQCLEVLGDTYRLEGSYDEARHHYKEALALYQKLKWQSKMETCRAKLDSLVELEMEGSDSGASGAVEVGVLDQEDRKRCNN